MKQLINILSANIKFNFQRETAYSANNLISLISTVVFTITIIIFYKVVFGNISQIAGYNYNEALFILFLIQITFYVSWKFCLPALFQFIQEVNNGNFDLLLTKPVPTLFYLLTRRIDIFSFLVEGFPTLVILALLIKWDLLLITPVSAVLGVLVWLLGIVSLISVYIIFSLPVFWLGEGESILNLITHVANEGGTTIPLEGYSKPLQIFFGGILPVMVPTIFASSVFLNKSNIVLIALGSIVVTIVFWFLRKLAWQVAIRNYTSASS